MIRYAKRHREGKPISTAMAEPTVNQILDLSHMQTTKDAVVAARRSSARSGSMRFHQWRPNRQTDDMQATRRRNSHSLPIKSQPGLRGTMPIIVVRMQVLAGRRDRFMPQVVPHVSEVKLPVHHV
jgi:hypothetical protein